MVPAPERNSFFMGKVITDAQVIICFFVHELLYHAGGIALAGEEGLFDGERLAEHGIILFFTCFIYSLSRQRSHARIQVHELLLLLLHHIL